MDTKKSGGKVGRTDARSTPPKAVERNQPASRKPSTPSIPAAAAKKREKSVPPPPVATHVSAPAGHEAAANENDRAKKVITAPGARGRLPTGSLHTEAREPAEASRIKLQLTALVNAQQKLADLKRASNRNFFEIGELLHRIRDERLYEVKGYSSFESYIERETNLGQQFCAQVVRIHETFLPEAARMLGFSRLSSALAVLENEPSGMTAIDSLRGARTAIPPHKL